MKRGVMIVFLIIVLAISVNSATRPNPGHPADEVGGGTFFGGEDYLFPAGSNVNITEDLNVTGNFSAGPNIFNVISRGVASGVAINFGFSSNPLTIRAAADGDMINYQPNGLGAGEDWTLELNDSGTLLLNSDVGDEFVVGTNTRMGVNTVIDGPDTSFEVVGGLCVSDSALDDCTTASGNIRADGTVTQNAFDLAERIFSDDDVEPGDVLVIDTSQTEKVKKSTESYDTTVAGIYSTEPGNILGWEDKGNVLLALAGRVPVKVTTENGPIKTGDLLTTSSTPGHAMRCDDKIRCIGAILGKALEPHSSGNGKIVALVTLQ